MPATTALEILTGAFETLGVTAPGETISTAMTTDALRRLNLMMSSLRLQPLTQPVQSREVFPLTADLGVYTIGPGGDFDTTRPTALLGAAILLNSQGTPVAITSITRTGNVATVTITSHGASSGQNVTIDGAVPADYNGTFPITVTGVNTFTYIVDGDVTTPATGTKTASFESDATDVIEVPRALMTDDAWKALQIKSLTGVQFTNVYYNPTWAADLGTINLWPIPNTQVNSLVIYRLMPLTSFATTAISYYLPDGCAEALEYNLARRLMTPYGVVDQGIVSDVLDMARTTLANFKRGSAKLTDLPTDPALTQSRSGGYNINSGTGGGSSN